MILLYLLLERKNMTKTNHQRIEEWYRIEEQTWTDVVDYGNGIWCYKNVLPKEMNILETILPILDGVNPTYNWMPAHVGYRDSMPDYRDCNDFKYRAGMIKTNSPSPTHQILEDLYTQLQYRQLQPVKNYAKHYKIGELRYWEAMNLVRYNPGQHFEEHCDHGFSYNCTVSLVAYLNDDYEGGELRFRLQDLTIKPEAGDLYIFPSNYIYPHKALPVENGTKYSLVTMLDYSDKYHSQAFYEETGR